jgi:NAD(P)-dependent dehydrogenase (short-subunit alcohol dehydrogenase family)
MLMKRLQDRVCLVTGAGQGIGKGIAIRLLAEGARVWICDRNPETLPAAVAELTADGPVDGSVTDVSKRGECQAMFDAVAAKWGRIDAVVNNAGGGHSAPFVDVEDDDWDRVLDSNLKGVYLCTQIAARLMIAQGTGGSIVNIGSTNGLRGQPGLLPYGAAKAGVINLSMSAALELGSHGIRVNALCPGTILSHGEADDREHPRLNALRAHTALDRLGRPADIAAAAAFLISDDASFVTGHALVVDGGLTARQLLPLP